MVMMAAVVLASLLPASRDNNQKITDSINRLNKVEDGMQRFMAAHGRRPCPADGQYDVNNANFGIEAANPGACTGGTPAAPMGPTNNVVSGMIPTKTLALPDDYAFDAWGRRFNYTVDIRATNNTSCYGLKTGAIQIESTFAGTVIDNVMAAYISHGPGGYGAWPSQGSKLSGRINTGIADGDKQANAGVNVLAPFTDTPTNFTDIIVSKDRKADFDDIVYYADNSKNTCCTGKACNKSTGFQAQGAATGNAGSIVLTLDLNGDGVADTAICAPNANSGAGAVYVIFGTKSIFYSTPFALPSGSMIINGVQCTSLAAGDVNGDGIQDLIIGASGANSGTGAVYVVLGGTGAWPANFNVSALTKSNNGANGANGWVIYGENNGDKFGASVAARDFNGDDYDDLLIGAPGAYDLANGGAPGDGAAYLLCGDPGPWASPISVANFNGIPQSNSKPISAPACGIKIKSPPALQEKFGTAATMGNIKGDQYADAAIGAPGALGNAGKIYLIGGGSGPFASPLDVTQAPLSGIPAYPAPCPPGCGILLRGAANDRAGSALDAGDINGDGFTDLIIGAPGTSSSAAGTTYVVFGNITTFSAGYSLSTISTTNQPPGFQVNGQTGDQSGTSVYGRSDVNGDGIQDLMIGAPGASPLSRSGAGGVYIVFGNSLLAGSFNASTLNGTNGVMLYGANALDAAGSSVAGGDVYNLGLGATVVGAPGNSTAPGTVDVLLGNHAWSATFDLNNLR